MLELAVPLWAYEARKWTSQARWDAIREAGSLLACGGDQLMFGRETRPAYDYEFYTDADGTQKYRKVKTGFTGASVVFNAIAKGLGCLAVENPELASQAIATIAGET